MIAKSAYIDPRIFDVEVTRLFSTGWQFVGLASELKNNRDFVCLDHAGATVVVQNFKGELRAFQNICSHRFNRIQTDERGNRPLMCGYHGWSFDESGFPAGMPKKEQYLSGDALADRARFCLPSYSVARCGQFVFVNLGGAGTLRDHLGEFWDVVEEIGDHIGAEIHCTTVAHAANWKLLVENVLECYHCATVHRDSFVPAGIGKLPIDRVTIDGDHSSSHFPRTDLPRENLRRRYFDHLKHRGMVHNSFYHIYVFPNLFISSGEGMSFYVGCALPRAVDDTRLRMRIFEPAVDLGERHRARQDGINEATIATSIQLVEEDRAVLENIQRSLKLADRPGAIGDEEVRIAAFFESYRRRMSAAAPVRASAA